MATGSGNKRKSSASNRRKTTSSNTRKKQQQSSGVLDEILLFLFLAISILLFLGTLGLLGSIGKGIKGILIGLLGMTGYLFPFVFFLSCAMVIYTKYKTVARTKCIASFVLLWVISCFAQLIFAKDVYINKISDYYTKEAKNGGFLGGIITHFMCKFLGMAGTIVLLILILVICIVLLTDKSIVKSVKDGSKHITEDFKRTKQYRREASEIRSAEREAQEEINEIRRSERRDRKVVKQQEKREAMLAAKRRRAEEKIAKAAESRMRFDKTDLRKQGFGEDYEAQDFVSETDTADPYDYSATEEEISEAREPESMFYGRASSFSETMAMPDTQAIIKSTSDAIAIANASGGILSATRIERSHANGEMTEITENYCADDDFVNYVNSNISHEHPIRINDDIEEHRRDAYERDLEYSEDTSDADYEEEIRALAEMQRKRSRSNATSEHGIRMNGYSDETVSLDDFENTDEYPEDEIYGTGYSGKITSNSDLSIENSKPAPVSQVVSQGKSVKSKRTGKYKLPPVSLLNEVKTSNSAEKSKRELNETAIELKDALHDFGLEVEIIGASRGPAVTRYEIQMPAGVSVKKITNLSDDIMLSLGAKDIRIEAPIPGKKAVGIELPNKESTMVHFRELIDSKAFKTFDSNVAFGVGKDLSGDIVVTDIAKMPHLLIAGATGSGKSVCINTLIMSILFKAHPDEVKLIMIDPKMVELSVYNDIPHLMIPVVTDPKKASSALAWAVNEMTVRYQKFAEVGVRDMKGFNSKIKTDPQMSRDYDFMPQIVIVVDELADLMMVASKEVEESICRLAQLARAAGIYLILATQRPSVDVITGLIKANMPSRIAFSVSSGVDSRTILDMLGAEKLLGNGDMLFFPRGYNKPSRVQGAFVSDDEVLRVVEYVKGQTGGNNYDENAINAVNAGGASSAGGSAGLVDPSGAFDDLFVVAGHAVIESQKASIGMLQRKFKIGFNRAARIMDQLSDEGVVGPEEGTKPRRILMSMEEFNNLLEEMNHS